MLYEVITKLLHMRHKWKIRNKIMNIEDIFEKLEILYRDIDAKAGILVRIHGNRLKCRMGCAECCMDDITVFEVEAENIRCHNNVLLNTGIPSGSGCAFLDESGACRIYPQRPYVCRTQGLPLRWLEELDDDALVEMRDICPLNEEGVITSYSIHYTKLYEYRNHWTPR